MHRHPPELACIAWAFIGMAALQACAEPASVALTAVLGGTGLGLMRLHFWARTAAVTLLLALIALLALPLGPQPGVLATLLPAAMLLRLLSPGMRRHFALEALARARHTAQRLRERSPSR
ncbi:hypothetical protein [Sphaerotilus uruguayifluvii]|uniref:Uncharacterized protein n=1 Tax=Sphaerotilus uruguayifluvii TaxID=2735897 RepID=A0ABX2G7G1_9BURK|nr:hypothetical protein [Leptothrix sp. C29]NRT58263.1 hypothetical protein [Leptothrix sp. C29]